VEDTYEIEHRGPIIRCHTTEAAIRLLQLLEQEDVAKDRLPWSSRDFAEFTERIKLHRRGFWGACWSMDQRLGSPAKNCGASWEYPATKHSPERVYLQTTRAIPYKPCPMLRSFSALSVD
jgi:hypothetical protein